MTKWEMEKVVKFDEQSITKIAFAKSVWMCDDAHEKWHAMRQSNEVKCVSFQWESADAIVYWVELV